MNTSNTSETLAYGGAADEATLNVARLIHHAFASPQEKALEWFKTAGLEHIRALRVGQQLPSACLLRIPMGQYFGGRSVPMMGIAGVACAPEQRGKGLARRLMAEEVRACAREGVALSCLYASTQSLYRQVGYEQAGHRFRSRLSVQTIGLVDRATPVRPLTDDDMPAVKACYTGFAGRFDGNLDRGNYCWLRIRKSREEVYHGFGIDDAGGGLAGYIFLNQERNPTYGRHNIAVSDAAFLTPAAGRRILGLLSDYATMAEEVVLHGGPLHPLLSLLPQQRFKVEKLDYWMLRLIRVGDALAARGYPAGLSGEVSFEVEDDIIPENTGTWALRIEAGRGSATKVAQARGPVIRAHVRALAAIYAGLYTPPQAQLLGWVDGDPDALARAGAFFAGGTPWMTDMF